MATIEIEAAKVSRIIQGYGFEVYEEITIKSGDVIKNYYTVWNKTAKVEVGDVVRVAGDYSAKVDCYTGKDNQPKTKVAVSINNAEVMLEENEAPF